MAFEDISAEMEQVADAPEEAQETGVEESEVAEQTPNEAEGEPTGKTDADSAFAEMRRAKESAEEESAELRRQIAQMQAEQEARADTFKRLTGEENAEINALAESMGLDPEDVLATIESEQESAKKDLRIEELESELTSIKASAEMAKDLQEIQKIDPNVKDLNDLGEHFVNYINAGLNATDAYYAVRSREEKEKLTPPKPIGKVNNEPVEKDFFSEAEVNAMTSEEKYANADKIMKSLAKWQK